MTEKMEFVYIALTLFGWGWDYKHPESAAFRALRAGQGNEVALFVATEDFSISSFDGSITATKVEKIGEFKVDEEILRKLEEAMSSFEVEVEAAMEAADLPSAYSVKHRAAEALYGKQEAS